jgi:membrane associated rhomboid family serine protease
MNRYLPPRSTRKNPNSLARVPPGLFMRVESMFIPIGDNVSRRTFPIIPCFLILINVAIFLKTEQIIGQDTEKFENIIACYDTFGLSPQGLGEGKILGVLTYMFLHGDFFHLLGNMVMLWAFSATLEAGLGRAILSVMYLFWGVIAGLVHCFAEWGGDTPLIGASGAIAGLIGAYTVAYGPLAKIRMLVFIAVKPFTVQVPAALFGAFWFLTQLDSAVSDDGSTGVAFYCHVGGFVAGALSMLVLRGELNQKIVKTKSGEAVLVDTNVPVVTEESLAAEAAVLQAEINEALSSNSLDCMYCGTELRQENTMGENLIRCSAKMCGRLNYLDASMVYGISAKPKTQA